jgi:hypothetical protein
VSRWFRRRTGDRVLRAANHEGELLRRDIQVLLRPECRPPVRVCLGLRRFLISRRPAVAGRLVAVLAFSEIVMILDRAVVAAAASPAQPDNRRLDELLSAPGYSARADGVGSPCAVDRSDRRIGGGIHCARGRFRRRVERIGIKSLAIGPVGHSIPFARVGWANTTSMEITRSGRPDASTATDSPEAPTNTHTLSTWTGPCCAGGERRAAR